MDIRAGATQSSVLGPLLCIVFYDDLQRLYIPVVIRVGFAGDLLLIVTVETQNTLEFIANKALDMVLRWMEIRKMELAFEKTKALRFKIRNTEIKPSKEFKYLAVVLDDKETRRSLLPL